MVDHSRVVRGFGDSGRRHPASACGFDYLLQGGPDDAEDESRDQVGPAKVGPLCVADLPDSGRGRQAKRLPPGSNQVLFTGYCVRAQEDRLLHSCPLDVRRRLPNCPVLPPGRCSMVALLTWFFSECASWPVLYRCDCHGMGLDSALVRSPPFSSERLALCFWPSFASTI